MMRKFNVWRRLAREKKHVRITGMHHYTHIKSWISLNTYYVLSTLFFTLDLLLESEQQFLDVFFT